mmetsp:Transcript_50701/g.101278  ORF Transcript_50701/g.101278 Transcript_50701/m.101278 type:complete len:358 (-) Transcript_50701:225-1298(-)
MRLRGVGRELDGVLAELGRRSLDRRQLLGRGLVALLHVVLKDRDRVRRVARPLLLLLAASLVLGVGRRVSVEAEGVYLQDRRPVLAHVIHHRPAPLQHRHHVLPVDLEARHAVVLALHVHVLVLRHVTRERVDRPPVVDHNEEQRQALLRRHVERLRHPPVLCSALAHKHHGDAVVVGVGLGVALAVEKDRARGSCGIRELLGDQRPPALHVGGLVEDVHRPARALARAAHLAEQLRHHSARVDARRQRVRVFAVVGVLLVAHFDGIRDESWDRLLAVVQMHETADVALHVLLIARSLELARQAHHGVGLDEILLRNVLILISLLRGQAKVLHDVSLGLIPRSDNASAHHLAFSGIH